MRAVILGLAVVASAARADERKLFTIADLRALAQHEAWGELVEHLDDIAPAGRDADWRALVQRAGVAVIMRAAQVGVDDAFVRGEALLARYPDLRDSKPFMAKRGEVGQAALEHCFRARRRADTCGRQLRAFVTADPTDGERAFRLAKLVAPTADRAAAAVAFAIAIRKSDDPRCADPAVRGAVLAGLAVSATADPELVGASVGLATRCWAALHDAVHGALGGDSLELVRNACPIVRARVTLSPLLTKRCDAAAKSE